MLGIKARLDVLISYCSRLTYWQWNNGTCFKGGHHLLLCTNLACHCISPLHITLPTCIIITKVFFQLFGGVAIFSLCVLGVNLYKYMLNADWSVQCINHWRILHFLFLVFWLRAPHLRCDICAICNMLEVKSDPCKKLL
ncbi:hypothetical protein AMTRI_Chr13g84890 [Amborella trichopoda]